MKRRKYRVFCGDFETTVYEGQTTTEVWASALVELYTEDVQLFHSINETFDYLFSLGEHVRVYYHNLKFDGAFILTYLLKDLQYKQAYQKYEYNGGIRFKWYEESDMPNDSIRYCISDKGQWYSITIRHKDKYISIYDSLKLLPFTVKQVGNGFKTKHRKLDMEYTGYRYAGCYISDEEAAYIKNDVLVIKEAMEEMHNRNHKEMTIGSCCLKEFKNGYDMRHDYRRFFPNLYEIPLDPEEYGTPSVGEYIRKAYRGGWCYIVPGKANKILHDGCTADVNSLYPYVMRHYENCYPVGEPIEIIKGRLPRAAYSHAKGDVFYYVRFRCRFYLKKGFLPFVQIKGNPLYNGRENLITSDYWDKKQKQYKKVVIDDAGRTSTTHVTMTMTMMDFELFQKHYDLVDLEILDSIAFLARSGEQLFSEYIDNFNRIKQTTDSPVERQLAKLFMNNLYGKFAMSTDSSFKVAYLKEDGSLGYLTNPENEKIPGYIAIGAAITSYARCYTITAAQKNFHGMNKPGFIYADTDSIHCDLPPSDVQGIEVDDRKLGCWKLEATWNEAIFVRQKTYIEHVTEENQKPINEPYYKVCCAGMPEKCKNLFLESMQDLTQDELAQHTEEEREFLSTKRTLKDFQVGLQIPGQLKARNIPGGVLLVEQEYTMNAN